MANIVVEIVKYLMIIMMAAYTFECFSVFAHHDIDKKKSILLNQNILMFANQAMAYLAMYLKTQELKMVFFYLAQVVLLVASIALYMLIYPRVSRLVINNMCMLLSIGLIMITRLDYDKATKQFIIIAIAMAISLCVPVIIRKVKFLKDWTYVYAGAGIVALITVLIFARTSDGAKLGFSVFGFGVQPSELVKILFVFYVASSFKKSTEFKNVVITTIIAAIHVLVLVVSTDLGAALIIFVVYLVMLYVATRQPLYMLAGLAAGSGASVVAYHLFGHIQTRVNVWRDPFAVYQTGGYQVAQSLFAIATGSWFGMGLFNGKPTDIPVADEDFIFSAISEELGLIFALCLILVCLSVYIMFLNIAMQLRNRFYKLVALGLGTCYIFQVFLTIGGVTKFIPSTGVTLPLVSYGGSSLLSTLIMFGIIQGLYILREDEEEIIEQRKEELRGGPRSTPPKKQRTAKNRKKKATKFEEIEEQRIR
ncbi:MAG: FtsW/RodA/SpoVE family cell cycle protein [Hespellia sp.]|nr:FtsW/RodA/SpoVE family cell cycle protein [Hespellia sp.]